MELVDIYNDKHEKLNYTKDRKELTKGEFRLSCFVWIINDNDELLMQQRTSTTKKYPNYWETASGGALLGEDAITGAIRELDEELGIKVNKEDLRLGSDEYLDEDLIGLNVMVDNKIVGEVIRLDVYPHQNLLVVKVGGKSCLIPYVSDIIEEVNFNEGYIAIKNIKGLI